VPSVEEIETALTALWKGRTGASVQAIKHQTVLMNLEYVRDRARRDRRVELPTPDQIARACQECIADACLSYTNHPNDASTARILMGVSQGAKGVDRATRRNQAMRHREITLDQLTHKRKHSTLGTTSTSYETRMLSLVAGAMIDLEFDHLNKMQFARQYLSVVELDYVDPGVDGGFFCESYEAHLQVEDGRDSHIHRKIVLYRHREEVRVFGFHDGWGTSNWWRNYNFADQWSGSGDGTIQITGSRLDGIVAFPVKEGPSDPLTLLFDVDSAYCRDYTTPKGQSPEAKEYVFGFFVAQEPPPSITLGLTLPSAITPESVVAEVVNHIEGGRWEKRETVEPDEDRLFRFCEKNTSLGMSYALRWRIS
jgi:hypothetical protein